MDPIIAAMTELLSEGGGNCTAAATGVYDEKGTRAEGCSCRSGF